MKYPFSFNPHDIPLSINERLPRKEKKNIKQILGENAYSKLAIAFNRTYLFKCEKETKLVAIDKHGSISSCDVITKGQTIVFSVSSIIASKLIFAIFLTKKQLKENFTLVKKTGRTYRQNKTIVNKFYR